MDEFRSNENVVYHCTFHVLWCTKYRRPVIGCAKDVRLKEIIREVCAERDAPATELQTKPDHEHQLVNCCPEYGIHRLVKHNKGRSSRLLQAEFPYLKSRFPTLWTDSYFAATVGGATLEVVKQYVENQRNF